MTCCSSLMHMPRTCPIKVDNNAGYQKCTERRASLKVKIQKQPEHSEKKEQGVIMERERPQRPAKGCFFQQRACVEQISFVSRIKRRRSLGGNFLGHVKSLNPVQRLKREQEIKLRGELLSVVKRMVKVSIAHGMDPVQRAGQTKESNEREASKYGRRAMGSKGFFASFFKLLLKLLFLIVFPIVSFKDVIVDCILKVWEDKHKKSRNSKKRISFVEKVLMQRQSSRTLFAKL